jgi:two-component system, NarL family, sensor histidine kinase BarA
MAKPRQLSFRRLLVTRILLLSVPVLLTGEMVVFKKARYTQLETARQNLTESAILKSEKILDTIASLKSNLLSASQTTVIRSGSTPEVQQFISQLEQGLPNQIECVQLSDLENNQLIASTCGDEPIGEVNFASKGDGTIDKIQLKVIVPPKIYVKSVQNLERGTQNKLQLMLSTPVFDNTGKMRYGLTIQSELQQKAKNKPGLLTGSTVVISSDGTILAHPIPTEVGTNIAQKTDASHLQKIVKNARPGEQDFLQFFFDKQGDELLGGYTVIDSPVAVGQKWVVLDVTTLENALYGLGGIKIILVILTIGLIGASLLASLYVAHYLARPLEKLRDYTLNIDSRSQLKSVPGNLQIREFNQLSQAIDQMVERLKAWAEELESAWEDAKSANQVKSQFLATTSHELRNPLNIIINCVRLVREDLCDNREEELDFLNRADETAIHLLGIINDLLDISKIEAGKLSVFLESIDLREVLKEVINSQSVNIQQKGLHLKVSIIDEQIPVKADSVKLKQVLINLIGNATKFTEAGSITITAQIQHSHDDISKVVVTVQDTGIGIELSQQQKLFRPFVMVESSTNQRFGGTGLGLAISRNLMELMEGTITLDSAGLKQGTTTTITLPLIEASSLGIQSNSEIENQAVQVTSIRPITDFAQKLVSGQNQ